MVKKLFLTLMICSFALFAIAQNSFLVSGTIKDRKETLPGAAIYVSGYKIATVSNNEGKFMLPNLPPGNYDILVQMIGYLPYTRNVVVSNKSVIIDVLLTENATTLNEVVIKPDADRLYHTAIFKDYFIGRTLNAKECKIMNLEVLNFTENKSDGTIIAKASDFIIIENKALGYQIKYLLVDFEYNYRTKMVYYAGYPTFQDLKGGKSRQRRWSKNRAIAYNGSPQHFFKSLYSNSIAENGFLINKMNKIKNVNRPSDSLINVNIKKLTAGRNGLVNIVTFNGSDSLSYWLRKRKEPKELSVLSRRDVLVDTLVKTFNKNLKMMSYANQLYIIYKNEKEPDNFSSTGHQQNRTPDLSDYQISVVSLIRPTVKFYENGGVSDTRSLIYEGYWAYEKVADMLPMDYNPAKPKELNLIEVKKVF